MNYDLDTPTGMKNAVTWTKRMLKDLNIGGVWAVPRSGMMIRKIAEDRVEITEGYADDFSIPKVLAKAGFKITVKESTK
jgi:hypothetical protein